MAAWRMPVNTPSAEYAAAAADWKIVRDCIDGNRAIKAAGECYVPRLTGQSVSDYQKYLMRGVFFNATRRTHQAMLGLLFRKPPVIEELEKIEGLKLVMPDADMMGNSFINYARLIMGDTCSLGHCGTLIDWSVAESRPYCAYYAPESILSAVPERVGGRMVLSLLVLHEVVSMPSTDPFIPARVNQWRVLRLNKAGNVEFELWREPSDKKGDPQVFQAAAEMSRRGVSIKAIPFVFHGAEDNDPCINPPPLGDIAHVNVSHFNTSVDLEHGRHLTGLPTPIACGFKLPKGGTLAIGSNEAWVSDNAQATAKYMEFTGQGLKSLTDAITEKQNQMAALGARLIEAQKKDAEAFDTVALRASSETSTMARIGQLGSESLSRVLAWCVWWTGAQADVSTAATGVVFALNQDFVSAAMPSDMLTALISAWQQQGISFETLFGALQKGEIIDDDCTMEEERQRIADNPPMPPPAPPTPGAGGAA